MNCLWKRGPFTIVCVAFLIHPLSSQEKPLFDKPPASVLTSEKLQNLVINADSIGAAFDELENADEVLVLGKSFEEFAESFMGFYEGTEDITDIQQSFAKLKRIQVPGIEKIFTDNGVGPGGFEVVLTLVVGIIIIEAETEMKDADYYDDNELEDLETRITQMRSLIHPKDMALLKDYRHMLLGLF